VFVLLDYNQQPIHNVLRLVSTLAMHVKYVAMSQLYMTNSRLFKQEDYMHIY